MLLSPTFVPALALAGIFFFLVERIVAALMGLFWSQESEAKQAASSNFLVACFEFQCSTVGAFAYMCLSLASAVLGILVWASALLVLGSVFYVSYEQSPWVWTDLIRAYNAFLGPFFQGTVVQVFVLINYTFRGAVPFWN